MSNQNRLLSDDSLRRELTFRFHGDIGREYDELTQDEREFIDAIVDLFNTQKRLAVEKAMQELINE